MLSAKLKTRVEIAHIRIDFLNHLSLQGLYVEDQARDTLIYAGDAEVRISDWFIFKDKPVLHYLSLHNTYGHLYRTASSKDWNYKFIEDAFSTGSKKSGKPFKFDLERLELRNVRFHMDDKWLGEDLDFDVGDMVINANSLDFDKKMLDVKTIDGKNTDIYVREYMGGRPKSMRPPKVDTFDTTPFNPGKWGVKVHNLDFANFTFHLKMNDKVPEPGLFDENHIDITKIMAKVNNINIVGDTIHGDVLHLNAQERCGIAIKEMRSRVTVSPIASICDHLYLETNHSKIKDYYAMHYKRFPDFLDYIDSVVMVGHVKNSTVDKRDIACFASQLKNFPETVLQVSGDGKGTVANLSGYNMNVSDGNVVFKGNVTMKGLPDIYKTYITCTNSEILSTGSGILHYAPQLRNSPDVALEKVTYAFFKGDYHGYIENFAVNGTLKTNLGSVTSDVKLDIPGFRGSTAVYSGTISSDRLNIGMLFRQPLFGEITLRETIAGTSFHPDLVQLNMDGVIDAFTVNDYTYHNIHTKGTLAKKQFNGSLLVDDPNLALEFDGGINYSAKALQLNATAHLLGSNFKALNLTKDTVTLSADFDLNCTGSNIDNFLGYAKLFNIDLKRNARRLAVDSVYVNASESEGIKTLTVQSNDVVANVRGTYELSKLPPSFQYYLSRYMPNYIKQPSKYAPDQNFEFTVTTGLVDSIFAVTYPLIRGFDNARLSGSLNTQTQRLALNVQVPLGIIGNVHLNDISVTATGDLNGLALSSAVENVVIGDSMLNGSLCLTATVSNDSANFNLGTTARSINSSLSLNGQVLARRDTLLLTLQPSQFYLNNNTWNVAGGSNAVYSDKYLAVHGFSLASGLQRITASSDDMIEGNPIIINAANIDLAQLSAWAGLADYQPDGRINGTIKLENIFTGFQLNANVKATDMMLGPDTVGTINLIGSYNAPRKLVSLDPQTGIYRNNASIVASGNISFDTLTDQRLDGRIQFNDAPVAWANPFLNAFLSHVAGTVNGSIDFSGSSAEPQIKGTLGLKNAAMKVDYLGCSYTIPTATVNVDNTRISFGRTPIFDRYNNTAILSGYFSHNHFKDMKMRVSISSNKIEAVNLTSKENDMFYGHLIASIDSFTIRGPFDNIRLRAYNASAAAKSHIYIPVISATGEVGTYSYVSFKTYGAEQTIVRKKRDKLNINIEANLNDLVEMTIIPDPAAGDEITATGEGNIQMDIPANNDIRVNGIYTINKGTYTYTFPQLKFITRVFNLNPGSTIRFNGPFMETSLDVDATYATTGRLYDLLTPDDKNVIKENATDLSDAKLKQTINVLLHMKGTLEKLQLTFDLELPEKHSTGTYAYTKLMRINQDDKQKFEQVGALLLVGNFIPPDGGVAGGTATSGALTNFSQILSSTASTGLTNIVNKLTGDNKINIDINYLNYNYSDPTNVAGINRNQISGTIRRNYLNDKLIVEVGGTSDWGRPASASPSTNFNITGDFRVQYLLSQPNGLRLNAFRNSNYDVTLDRSIVRSGMGISWRKSFDNLTDFLHGNAYAKKKREELDKALHKDDSTNKEGIMDLN